MRSWAGQLAAEGNVGQGRPSARRGQREPVYRQGGTEGREGSVGRYGHGCRQQLNSYFLELTAGRQAWQGSQFVPLGFGKG